MPSGDSRHFKNSSFIGQLIDTTKFACSLS